MRSIRLSLILCILVLLTLSLLTVSALAYREADISLSAKQDSMRQAYQVAHKERCQALETQWDRGLENDAKLIASSVRLQIEWPDDSVKPLLSLGAMSYPVLPYGVLAAPFALAQGGSSKALYSGPTFFLKSHIWNANAGAQNIRPTQKIQDIELPIGEEGTSRYFQVNSVTGDEWRSDSLGDLSFKFDPHEFSSDEFEKNPHKQAPLVEWKFDNIELKPGLEVRRVRAKFTRFSVSFPPWNAPKLPKSPSAGGGKDKAQGPPNGGKDKAPPSPAPGFNFNFSIYVQAARDNALLSATLAQYDEELQGKLAELASNSENSRAELRNRLLLIGGITLLAAFIGGLLVVRWGLAPMRQLSDAVSQVSEKDFRLPLNEKRLPSELRPIAERLTQTLDLLQRAFTREKQAAADISHELRTPLAAMMATLDVTLRKPRLAAEYHEVLVECRETGLQMAQLVERMLALARLDAGADQLRSKEVDVAKLADVCSALVRPLAEARGLEVTVEHNGPACLMADPEKLREVLTNLLHNAIEYNKPAGRIDVSVHRNNGDVELRVCDTGIGIAPEAREHIFERFYRADASRHAEGVHAGIGLALVKGYVDMMGGKIDLDSTVGVGTTFTIRLPVHEPKSE